MGFFLDMKTVEQIGAEMTWFYALQNQNILWRFVLHCFYVFFLLGKRSGRSKKWREMLKLPPVSQCEGIRCSIGECPVEQREKEE